ncbi:YifB family Mg chelatase-like AAA ATPase [Marispirochaeta sp.]|uniref:YifB family Mg chelatase-like AAA ATPase n=1 Tax=Marispirochaeta sp. TaxID=2038653 RepID=UPI0029C8114D|nr:YifB family Mg chelatase-like AAA ATPase [Marispirochaeta sp.]
MTIYSYASFGYEGELVTVEVDLRPALPGIEIVGLPDSAIREAKERIRVAIRNSGFEYPSKRILINLYPAGVPKAGASFDLPIALGILAACGIPEDPPERILAMGELQLSGRIRAVDGVIAALHESEMLGNLPRLVPGENSPEAAASGLKNIYPVTDLTAAVELLQDPGAGKSAEAEEGSLSKRESDAGPDYGDMAGCPELLRALQIAAVGGHHTMLFGPPGSGKSMAAVRFPSILPSLFHREALEVTRIYSVAGKLPRRSGLIKTPPFRKPHHSASREGLIGGGPFLQPGEVSLAHNGVLLLDEAAEFQSGVLQALREPVEQRRVDLVRAQRRAFFPASFQLLLTLNPCPCGNLGKEDAVCLCTDREISRYWKTLGGALLDRIDIRIPLQPAGPEALLHGERKSSDLLREQVSRGRTTGRKLRGVDRLNSELEGRELVNAAALDPDTQRVLLEETHREGFSNRAVHGVLKVARSIADLEGSGRVLGTHIVEAVGLRGVGENLFYSGLRVPAR